MPDNILGYKEAMANGDRYYIAARFERDKEQVPRKFVVGDGEIYGDYLNAPLEPSCKKVYKAYVRAATEVNGVREHSKQFPLLPSSNYLSCRIYGVTLLTLLRYAEELVKFCHFL